MGNCLRRSCPVHPAFSGDGGRGNVEKNMVAGEKKDGTLRIKVRIRRDKLEELLNLASHGDESEGGKIGFLILKECMEGRLPARVLDSGDEDDVRSDQWCGSYNLVSQRLSSIKEE